jgi:8-oxo-dGTP pyrophosphatase MutT (NUDIX family)
MSIRTLSSELVWENPWLRVREDRVEYEDGRQGVQAVVERDDFAVIVPEENDGFHLVEQYRYATARRSWEFPSGSFPMGVSGSPEEMAHAELREETGFTARVWRDLGLLHVANGSTDQAAHVFHATGLTPGPPEREVGEQDMRERWFSRSDFEAMVRDGVITDGPTVAAYLLLQLHERT